MTKDKIVIFGKGYNQCLFLVAQMTKYYSHAFLRHGEAVSHICKNKNTYKHASKRLE